jgi:glycosyltransferase involved in cell wall biosynthesis
MTRRIYKIGRLSANHSFGHRVAILREGFDFIPIPLSRRGMNPLREPLTLAFLVGLYRRLRPDLIQHVTIKPVLYGSLVARLLSRELPVVNIISGLGYAFSLAKRAIVLRPLVKMLYRLAPRRSRSRTIFQNPDDFETFVDMRLVRREHAALILGSGVDCSRFLAIPEPEGDPVVMLPSRMLWDKGVKEYVEAACRVRETGESVRFVLVGGPISKTLWTSRCNRWRPG